ncbi:hypothetical protein V8F20_001581 [Naviculisporaceae sp. PSN 640]
MLKPRNGCRSTKDNARERAVFLEEGALQIFMDYQPGRDDTAEALGRFVEHLPNKGPRVLMTEIDEFSAEPEKLRKLRNSCSWLSSCLPVRTKKRHLTRSAPF